MQKTKTTTVKKPVEDKMINLQVSKKLAKTILTEVECSLDNTMYFESDFDELYQIYKLLKSKLSA